MRLLDVGCGWGSLILHAAEHYGVHATGITLAAQQRDFIAKRVAEWLDQGWAKRAVVNFKLPMKQRHAQLQQCLALLAPAEVRCKQLYHDREEVTAVILP